MANKPNRKGNPTTRQYADRRARGGGQMCKSNTKEGVRCKNPVAQGEQYCYKHRNGRPAVQARSTRQSQARTPAPRVVQARSTMQPIRQAVSATSQAVAAVQTLASVGWQERARVYVTEQIGEAEWSRLESRWRPNRCKKFAKAADQIEAFRLRLGHLERVDQKLPAIGLLLQPLNPLGLHARQAVILLRAAGVAICVARAQLGDCQCLKAMLDDASIGPQLITSVLNDAITRVR